MKPPADHFSVVAPAYAACRPAYPDELFEYLAGLTELHELAWDCAAGSGQATIPLARIFRRVRATDVSDAMLAQAPAHPRVEYRVAPAPDSGLEGSSADLVTVAQALHWLELDTFYPEVDRVLKAGGVLAVWSYGNQHLEDEALDHVLRRFYHDIVGPYWPAGRRHVEAGYRTLPFPYDELEAPTITMKERWTLSELVGYIGTWSATQRFRESEGVDPLIELERQLAPRWGPPDTARSVHWPLSLRVGRHPT
jgi:SAM-dependent methyltransferase